MPSLPIRALRVSGRLLAIPPKIRSSLPQALGGFSGQPGVLSRCLGRVLPRVILLFVWHIQIDLVGVLFGLRPLLCVWFGFLSGLLFSLTKRKSGWGICGSSWFGGLVCFVVSLF